jgi:UPF0716 protein FxsA
VTLRWRLLVFGYPLAEILVFWGVASLIGWGWALLLLVIGVAAGWALVRNAGAEAARGRGDRALVLGVAGVLFMVPGFLTDLAALVLLVPPVHRALGTRLRAWVQGSPIRMGFAQGDVISGEVIRRPPTQSGGELPGAGE